MVNTEDSVLYSLSPTALTNSPLLILWISGKPSLSPVLDPITQGLHTPSLVVLITAAEQSSFVLLLLQCMFPTRQCSLRTGILAILLISCPVLGTWRRSVIFINWMTTNERTNKLTAQWASDAIQ